MRDVAIIRADIYTDLQQKGVPMRVVAKDSRRTVIANDIKQMNLSTFAFIITGVLLNAVAQLLLKAGTNALGGAIHVNARKTGSPPASRCSPSCRSWPGWPATASR